MDKIELDCDFKKLAIFFSSISSVLYFGETAKIADYSLFLPGKLT